MRACCCGLSEDLPWFSPNLIIVEFTRVGENLNLTPPVRACCCELPELSSITSSDLVRPEIVQFRRRREFDSPCAGMLLWAVVIISHNLTRQSPNLVGQLEVRENLVPIVRACCYELSGFCPNFVPASLNVVVQPTVDHRSKPTHELTCCCEVAASRPRLARQTIQCVGGYLMPLWAAHCLCVLRVWHMAVSRWLHFVRNDTHQRNSIQCVCCCLSKRFTRRCRGVILFPNAWSNCPTSHVCCCELRGRWHLRICLFWASKKMRGRAGAAVA